jgi:hypothetical protein
MDAEFGKQPTADKGADDANDDITQNAEAAAVHDLTGEPAGDQANQ